MPEHFHLLIREPEKGDPSLVMKMVMHSFAQMVLKKRLPTQLDLWADGCDEHVW